MQQTLLVLLGVILVGLYGLSRHEGYAHQEDSAAQREVEVAALNAFDRWKGHLTGLAFDECQVTNLGGDACPANFFGLDPDPNFSSTLGPDPLESGLAAFDDFDDFDEYDAVHEYIVRGAPMAFRVRIDSVYYVDPETPWQYSASPTTAKQARLQVFHERTRADGRAAAPIGIVQRVTVLADGSLL